MHLNQNDKKGIQVIFYPVSPKSGILTYTMEFLSTSAIKRSSGVVILILA